MCTWINLNDEMARSEDFQDFTTPQTPTVKFSIPRIQKWTSNNWTLWKPHH
jgi:hypothetical protein